MLLARFSHGFNDKTRLSLIGSPQAGSSDADWTKVYIFPPLRTVLTVAVCRRRRCLGKKRGVNRVVVASTQREAGRLAI